jgi:hypothetical protein
MGEVIPQALREVERVCLRNPVDAGEQLLGATPADLDATEQIGLGARHLEDARRLERHFCAEDLRVGLEAHRGAAPVRRTAEILELALGDAALEHLAIELLAARHFDLDALGQRVDHRDADAVQAARGRIGLGVELAARMQRGHDHFERGLLREFRMRVDRNAAAVVDHRDVTVGRELHLDPVGMAVDRLVHRVVDDLGEQMVQRLLVGAADIHAGPAAHRLQSLQHLDVAGRIAGLGGFHGARGRGAGAARRGLAEQV